LQALLHRSCEREKDWHFQTNSHIESSPVVAGGKVFFGAGDEGVFGLDAKTGRELWHFNDLLHVDTSRPWPAQDFMPAAAEVALEKQRRCSASTRETGKAVWRKQTDLARVGSPLIDGEEVLLRTRQRQIAHESGISDQTCRALVSVLAKSGQAIWRWNGDGVFRSRSRTSQVSISDRATASAIV